MGIQDKMTNTSYFTTQSAVLRLAHVPLVRSACALLTVYYSDTKSNHPAACSLLESSVVSASSAAYDRFFPVFHKMEPQIVYVNALTCRGLDWLENRFPMLQKPPEQITADARGMLLEVKDLVSIVGGGTLQLLHNTVTWAAGRMQLRVTVAVVGDHGAKLSLVTRAPGVASRRSNFELCRLDAPKDRRVAAADAEAGAVEGPDVGWVSTSIAELVASLTAQILRSTLQSMQITLHHVKEHFGVTLEINGYQAQVKQQFEELLLKSPPQMERLLEGLLTQSWSLPQDLPQQIQEQLLSAIFFVYQMYTLLYAIPQQDPPLSETTPPRRAPNRTSGNHSPVHHSCSPTNVNQWQAPKRHVKTQSANGSSASLENMLN